MRVIKRNIIRCKLCGDVIESKSVHDFRECKCKKCYVDGGHEYVRVGGENLEDIEFLTEYDYVPGYYVSYLSKAFPNEDYYTSNSLMTMDRIKILFPEERYYLLITDEDGNVVFDTLTEFKKIKKGKENVR
jgi:hypothetical protein